MKVYTCPDCGRNYQEGFVPSECTGCGCPSNVFTVSELASKATNISPSLESSNDLGAEHVINGLAEVSKWVGILIGCGGVLAGIVILSNGGYGAEMIGTILIIAGIVFFILGILYWAVLKLLVNISYRLTRLDNKYNPE